MNVWAGSTRPRPQANRLFYCHNEPRPPAASAKVVYSYDAANRRTSMTLPDGISVAYGYDNASRLTSVTYKNGSTTVGTLNYGYDPAGHLIAKGGTLASVALPAAVASASYNANNQLTLWGSQGFAYDLNGNMTWDGSNYYRWNTRNQLTALYPDGGTFDGGAASHFVYDAFGRRQQKIIGGAGGATDTEYLYDQTGNIVVEYTKDGGQVTLFDYATFSPDELICTEPTDGGVHRTLDTLVDINGSVVGLVTDGGVIQGSYAYEPYGNVTYVGDAGTDQQYTAREDDIAGLLQYNRWRYYLPVQGRWASEDPIGISGGTNLYGYGADNPVQLRDPEGEQAEEVIDVCAPAAAAAAAAGAALLTAAAAAAGDALAKCCKPPKKKDNCSCLCGGGGTLYGDGTKKVKDQAACQSYCNATYGYGATKGFCR